MVSGRDSLAAYVVVVVDTHKDEHVAVAIDQLGARLGERRVATTPQGYAHLDRWACGLGQVRAFGIEGTGSYAGLSRFLTSRHIANSYQTASDHAGGQGATANRAESPVVGDWSRYEMTFVTT